MLTIKDLSTNEALDSTAMTTVRGGYYESALAPLFSIANTPIIDAGVHNLVQGQAAAVNQAGNLGGFNKADNYQVQNGFAGQFVG